MRTITISDGRGREITMPSVARASREMGVPASTLRNRLKDGNWIHRDGYVPVRVR